MPTDEEKAAIDELGRSIQKFYDVIKPNEFVTSWVLIVERTSIALEQDNKRVVGVTVPEGQSFVTTRGLMNVALDNERMPRA